MAFVLGLASSLHCVGMCGPLALAVPMKGPGRRLGSAIYHAGRILVYVAGGWLFGLIGRGVYLAGWQQGVSVVLGIAILAGVAIRRLPYLRVMPFLRMKGFLRVKGFLRINGFLRVMPFLRVQGPGLFGRLQRAVVRLWRAPSWAAIGLLGMVNGLLPCGMVYVAIAGAVTRPRVGEAAGFMAFFGMGTLPLLLVLHYAGNRLGAPNRLRLRRLLPVVTVVVGILLILRGLDLGIPYVSPVLAKAPGHVVECH